MSPDDYSGKNSLLPDIINVKFDKRSFLLLRLCRVFRRSRHGDENNSLINKRVAGIPGDKAAERLLCVTIFNHDMLEALIFFSTECVITRYTNNIVKSLFYVITKML